MHPTYLLLVLFTTVNFAFSLKAGIPPRFTITPAGNHEPYEVLYVRPGGTVKVSCKAEGSPAPEYKWMSIDETNGDFVQLDPKFVLGFNDSSGEHRLQITRDGNYSCMASNTQGSALTKPIPIVVAEIEPFRGSIAPPEEIKVSPSASVSLPCRNADKLNSKPDAEIIWKRRELTSSFSSASSFSLQKNMLIDPTGTLHFLWTEDSEFEYVYSCSAYNRVLGNTVTNPSGIYLKKKSGNSTIPYNPTLLYSRDVTVFAGKQAQLTCIFSKFPSSEDLNISWYDNGNLIGTGHTIVVPGEYSMTDDVMHRDCICMATVGKHNATATVKLTTVSPPIFLPDNELHDQTVPVEKHASFHCQARFSRAPPTWYVNGQKQDIRQPNSGTMSLSSDSTILTLHGVSHNSQTCFQCSVYNTFSRIYGNGCLTVIDKITPLIVPESVYILDEGSSVEIRVEATCDDRYLDQLKYEWIIYKETKDNPGVSRSTKDYILLPNSKLDEYIQISPKENTLIVNYHNSKGAAAGPNIFTLLKTYNLSEVLAVKIGHPFDHLLLNFSIKADMKGDTNDHATSPTSRLTTKPFGQRGANNATMNTPLTSLIFGIHALVFVYTKLTHYSICGQGNNR